MENKKACKRQAKKHKNIKISKIKHTKEEKKLLRAFALITAFILFGVFTASGILYAAARTAYIQEGREYETLSLKDFSITDFFSKD